mgnify:FL=1
MILSVLPTIAELSYNKHVMLLFENNISRSKATIDCINEALKEGKLCVYASVDVHMQQSNYISNFIGKIVNYENNVRDKNLHIIDLYSYYESALIGNFEPFNKLKSKLEKILLHRRSEGNDDNLLIFADAACELSKNQHFNECEILERWWEDIHTEWLTKKLNVTLICPHAKSAFQKNKFQNAFRNIQSHHTTFIKLEEDYPRYSSKVSKETTSFTPRIIITESNVDMQNLYSDYLGSLGIFVQIIENGKQLLEFIENTRNFNYELIILDTHLSDMDGVDVAKKIHDKKPEQRIVLTTTFDCNRISKMVKGLGIQHEDILQKPFLFSNLLSVINAKRNHKMLHFHD